MSDGSDEAQHAELAGLLRTLREIENRIVELTSGQIDAAIHDDGGTLLLPKAREALLAQAATAGVVTDILDSLPAHIALLDPTGIIVSVNEAWRLFARRGGINDDPAMLGADYLAVSDSATDDAAEYGRGAAAGIREVLAGSSAKFELEYPCETPDGMRWFRLVATPVRSLAGRGATVMHMDITEARMSADVLRRSEGMYRALFDDNPQPTWVYDRETLRFLAVNQAAVNHYGYSRDEFLAMTIADIRPAEDVGRLLQQVTAVPAGDMAVRIWRHVRRDGSVIDVEISSSSLDFEGRPARLVLAIDVTDRLATAGLLATHAAELEAALAHWAASESSYRALIEGAGDAVLVADDHGRYLDANPAASELLGLPRDQIIGRSLADFVDEVPQAGDTPEAWAAFLESGEARGMVRIRRPAGAVRDAEYTATAHVSPGRHMSILRDVTERRVAEESLRRSESLFRTMLLELPAYSLITSLDGKISFINDALLAAIGYTREEVLGRPNVDLLATPEDREAISSALTHTFASRTIVPRWENEVPTRAGGRRLVRWSSAFLHADGEIVGLASIGEDVGDQRVLEEQLRQSQRLEAVGQLTGGVAHDFNNLLTVILGNGELLDEALGNMPQEQELAKMTVAAAERGAELTKSLLAFARRQPLAPQSVDVDRLLADLDSLLRRTLGEHVELEISRTGRLWPALIDPTQLEGAVLNLALNARDAMPGGGRLTIETANTRLDADYAAANPGVDAGQYVMVAVSDTGTGIDPDILARVFDPFFTTKAKGAGTGLGLSMVHGFVKQSDGHIKIYSEPGHGTTVRVYLPRATNPAGEPETTPTSLVGGTETVLLVEDDDLVRQYAQQVLSALGYQIISATDGPTALAILTDRDDIDLLFTDIIMPGGMNGRQLADAAVAARPGLRVLYTSGYTENAIVHHGRLDPGVHLLTKPYRRTDLAHAIRETLDQ